MGSPGVEVNSLPLILPISQGGRVRTDINLFSHVTDMTDAHAGISYDVMGAIPPV